MNLAISIISFIDSFAGVTPHLGLVLGIVLVAIVRFFFRAKESNEDRLKRIEERFYTRIFIILITLTFSIIVYSIQTNEVFFFLSLLMFTITLIGFVLDLFVRRQILKNIQSNTTDLT